MRVVIISLCFVIIFIITNCSSNLIFTSDLEKAINLLNNGEYEEVKNLAEKILENDPLHTEALLLRSFSAYFLNEKELALEDLEIANELKIRYPFFYLLRGSLNLEYEKFEKAISDFLISLKLFDRDKPQHIKVLIQIYHLLAQAYIKTNDYDQAISNLKEALEIEPIHLQNLNLLAYVYLLKGDADSCLYYSKLSFDYSQNNSFANYLISKIYIQQLNFEQAIKHLNIAEEQAKNDNSLLILIQELKGDYYYSLGDFANAEIYFKKSLETFENFKPSYFIIYYNKDKKDTLISKLKKIER